ncbi:unnamed protein product [Phytophthora fragariaefolia]|uniref:Unnamed protein product n=1 Tax=Phytophthora fragariaefolia TaxID=1490495 RepID=A0A9W7D4V3_9STRA|nr:unnamed protein product [Phytophthora fragariaefolia]
MGNPRPVERNLVAELDGSADDDDDDDQGVVQGERPPLIPRATRNADTLSVNKVLEHLSEEMSTRSEWMMMFAPVAVAQAKWPVLGPELTQPINSTGINQLVEDTVLLLMSMGYRCNSRPNSLILSGWSLARASAELTQWKRRLRAEFGLEKAPGAWQTIMDRVAEFTQLGTDPSRDSHMSTPKKGKPRSGRYDHLYDASDETELGDSRVDSADLRGIRDETVKVQIRQLSYDKADRDSIQYLALRTHFSLDKVAELEGKWYRSDASLQWVKRFIYEMKGTRMPQNSWCEPFSLSLDRAAKSWYRQLPKKTQQRWSLLSEAFLDYYCSQFDQSACTRYYSARRKENEPICDFLIRMNGYARTAKIQNEKGGADAADHVEQFLLNCGDDDIMDLLYPLQLADIQRVEQIINKKILGEKRKKQRDRLVASRVGEARRNDGPQRRDVSRRGDIRRDHRDGRRGETHEPRREAGREPRRDDRRSRRDDNRERRVTVANATVDDLYRGGEPRQLSRRSHSRDSSSSASAYGLSGDSGSDSDHSWNYVDAGAVSDRSAGNSDSATGRVPMIAENDAVTRLSDPAMVLVEHAEAAGTQHTSAIGGANSASRCMMRGASRCSSTWRSSPSSSAPPSTSQRYPLTYTTSTSREI